MQNRHIPVRTPKEAESIIDATYYTLKWPWLMIMSFALTQATANTFKYLNSMNHKTVIWQSYTPSIVLFAIFLITFVRFFMGDSRYLDLFAYEVKKAFREQNSRRLRRLFSRTRRIVDTLSTLIHGVIFVCLAHAITEPVIFFSLFICLLLLNTTWLMYVVQSNSKTAIRIEYRNDPDGTIIQRKTEERKHVFDTAPRKWILNNWIHFGALICVSITFLSNASLTDGVPLICFVAACICAVSNTVVDFTRCWRFYYPPIEDLFPDVASSIEQNDTAKGQIA